MPLQGTRIGDHQHKVRVILVFRIEHGLFRDSAVFRLGMQVVQAREVRQHPMLSSRKIA